MIVLVRIRAYPVRFVPEASCLMLDVKNSRHLVLRGRQRAESCSSCLPSRHSPLRELSEGTFSLAHIPAMCREFSMLTYGDDFTAEKRR